MPIASKRQYHILWVDDMPDLLEHWAHELQVGLPATTIFASTVHTAMHKLQDERFDLIITDWMVPAPRPDDEGDAMNGGITLLRFIAQQFSDQERPPVVIFSMSPRSAIEELKQLNLSKVFVLEKVRLRTNDFIDAIRSIISAFA